MPRLDGTGPRGQGPQTGRGCGNCNKESEQRPLGGTFRRGGGRRFGIELNADAGRAGFWKKFFRKR